MTEVWLEQLVTVGFTPDGSVVTTVDTVLN
jgi:hypothetical protein